MQRSATIHYRKGLYIGEHRSYDTCRFCLSATLQPFISFGNVPLAGGFFSKNSGPKEFAQERLYPMTICFCTHCGLVQVREVVESPILFEHYFYFSSAIGSVVEHFSKYADELVKMVDKPNKKFVVEIGCNDGVFLKPLMERYFNVLGVDPATNVVEPLIKKGMPIKRAYFGEQAAREIVKKQGKADIILGSNSLAHIDDMHDVARGISLLLKPNGFLSMETHYLGVLLKESQYDFMYHEHQSYYSLAALSTFFAMYDMEIFDAYIVPMHAGSMRTFVQKKGTGKRKKTARLRDLAQQEKKLKLDQAKTFLSFSSKISKTRAQLMALIAKLKKQKKTIAGYGASGRATIISAYCELTADHLDYIIDDAPAKLGAFTPGNHLKIQGSNILSDPKKRPDYCLILAWSFAGEIMKRNKKYLELGGKFILPLPKVRVVLQTKTTS